VGTEKERAKRWWDRRMNKGLRWVAGGSDYTQEMVSTSKDDRGKTCLRVIMWGHQKVC